MANSLIELHDTRITGIRTDGAEVVLDADAYVHVSEGEPGVDDGAGWSRPIRITVREGAVRKDFDGQALWITDGSVWIGERIYENMLPIALDEVGVVRIEFAGGEGRLTVTGVGMRVETTGEGEYVEKFSGRGAWEQSILRHLEKHIGLVGTGGTVRDGVQVVRYASSPIVGATAFSSLGLNRHALASRNGETNSMELVVLARAGGQIEAVAPRLLANVVGYLLDSHCALMRGDVIGLQGLGLSGTSFAALYVSAPAYFPEPFASVSDGGRTCVFAWLVPISASEARFVAEAGWSAFEARLAEVDPDLLDESRKGIA